MHRVTVTLHSKNEKHTQNLKRLNIIYIIQSFLLFFYKANYKARTKISWDRLEQRFRAMKTKIEFFSVIHCDSHLWFWLEQHPKWKQRKQKRGNKIKITKIHITRLMNPFLFFLVIQHHLFPLSLAASHQVNLKSSVFNLFPYKTHSHRSGYRVKMKSIHRTEKNSYTKVNLQSL